MLVQQAEQGVSCDLASFLGGDGASHGLGQVGDAAETPAGGGEAVHLLGLGSSSRPAPGPWCGEQGVWGPLFPLRHGKVSSAFRTRATSLLTHLWSWDTQGRSPSKLEGGTA